MLQYRKKLFRYQNILEYVTEEKIKTKQNHHSVVKSNCQEMEVRVTWQLLCSDHIPLQYQWGGNEHASRNQARPGTVRKTHCTTTTNRDWFFDYVMYA